MEHFGELHAIPKNQVMGFRFEILFLHCLYFLHIPCMPCNLYIKPAVHLQNGENILSSLIQIYKSIVIQFLINIWHKKSWIVKCDLIIFYSIVKWDIQDKYYICKRQLGGCYADKRQTEQLFDNLFRALLQIQTARRRYEQNLNGEIIIPFQ